MEDLKVGYYSIWWGIAARPVDRFIADNDFTGKTVIPFCTCLPPGWERAANCWRRRQEQEKGLQAKGSVSDVTSSWTSLEYDAGSGGESSKRNFRGTYPYTAHCCSSGGCLRHVCFYIYWAVSDRFFETVLQKEKSMKAAERPTEII